MIAHARRRRGSALVLVLVMTLSMAGLAVSAVLLTSSSSLIQRFYDKDKDFRLYARAALGQVKSAVQRDTTIVIPQDTAYRALTAATIADAGGASSAPIRVNGYAAYTGDTSGTYIPFLTVLAQAYDTLGVRSVQRLDMQSEAFSRYAFFVDTFLPNTAMQAGLHIRGRVHGNRNWVSAAAPGTTYYDTVTAVGSLSGTANLIGTVSVTGTKRIRWPTSTSLSGLPTLASAGKLSFAAVSAAGASSAISGGVNVSGDPSGSTNSHRGTRLRFRPVDVNNNGSIDAEEGFVEIFDLAQGIDTASLRVDPVSSGNPTSTPTATNVILLNQCGILASMKNGRREFFPAARFRETWVQNRLRDSAYAPTVSAAKATRMGLSSGGNPTTAALDSIFSVGQGYARCFPAGSPYLMLTERHVYDPAGPTACVVTTSTAVQPYGWGATAAGCTAAVQYGGQDTTFTATVTRCFINGTDGRCGGNQVALGSWRLFSSGGGTSTVPGSGIATTNDAENPYLWPLSATYNAASRGVIHQSATHALFVSDTLRGYATLYTRGRIVLIDDLVYDKDPVDSDALCRNFLGIIADTSIKVANNALNFPRRVSPTGTYRMLGSPDFTLHGIMLALSTTTSTSSSANIRAHGVVGVEDSTTNGVGGLTCLGTSTSGGCWDHTGGAIMKVYHGTTGGAGRGLIRRLTPDPCMAQQTNRRPPFFPLTGKFVDYKAYEVDPRTTSTWTMIKTYVAALRGNARKEP